MSPNIWKQNSQLFHIGNILNIKEEEYRNEEGIEVNPLEMNETLTKNNKELPEP